jgi:Cu(I)/Ag(I) efflux system protein CusF
MKRIANGVLVLNAVAIGLATLLAGCDRQPETPKVGTMVVPPAANPDQIHHATGVVKEIDPAKNTVIVTNEPIESMKWPSMTMPFVAKDKALFDKFSLNKTVSFDFKQVGSEFVVIAVK